VWLHCQRHIHLRLRLWVRGMNNKNPQNPDPSSRPQSSSSRDAHWISRFIDRFGALGRGRSERRMRSVKDRFKRMNPSVRFLSFMLLCVAINIVGLIVTQGASSSMFYFDTIGTALAALLSGLSGGLIVAFLSNILGAYFIGEPSYAFFGFSNAACAIVWAVLPRLGAPLFGSDMLHPGPAGGYARQIFRIFVVGIAVAVASSITSFFVQTTLLSIHIDTASNLIEAASGGNNVSKNNIILVAALMQSIEFNISSDNSSIIFLISSLTSNIPDKIISTATAVVIIMSFFKVPRINKQILYIKSNKIEVSEFYNKSIFYFLFIGITYYYFYMRMTNWSIGSVSFIFGFLLILIFSRLVRYEITCVVDPYGVTKNHNDSFYPKYLVDKPMSFQRDVFEDTLKIILVIFSISQFVVNYNIMSKIPGHIENALVTESAIRLVIDGREASFSMPTFSVMLVYNALILTGFRYSMIVFIRLIGRF
jgi:hypothetical protein